MKHKKWMLGCLLLGALEASSFEAKLNDSTVTWTQEELTEKLDELATWDRPNVLEWSLTKDLGQNVGATTKEVLDQLGPQVIKTENKDLIALMRRAATNMDRLLPNYQMDPQKIYNKHFVQPKFTTSQTHLTVEVGSASALVTTKHTIKRESEDTSLVLNAEGHKVHRVNVNGRKLSPDEYTVTDTEIAIRSLPEDAIFEVELTTEIDPFANTSGQGLYVSAGCLTTQCESEGARCIFPCQDQPAVLSEYTVRIIADTDRYPVRISNGNLVSEEKLEDGRSVITWHDPYPKPSYLFAMVLGDLGMVQDTFTTRSGREVKLKIYTEKGKEKRAEYALYATKKAMQFDEEMFDREYDLDEYKQVAMPDFNAGAMENKGLVIFNEPLLLVDSETGTDMEYQRVAEVISHEYCHNWSGNRVTVRNWFELALKEAFTDFRAQLFSEWFNGAEQVRPLAVERLRDSQFSDDASPKAHPIMVDAFYHAGEVYDTTTYVKGREVFRMLKTILDAEAGSDGFRTAQNAYFARYDGQAVTFRELLTTLQEVSGVDLTQFERWFLQPGTPKVTASLDYDAQTKTAKLHLKQQCPHPKTGDAQQPFDIPLNFELLAADGSVLLEKQLLRMKGESETYTFSVSEKPVPVFLHDYSAPIRLHYGYSDEELMTILKFEDDAFAQVDAGKIYTKRVLQDLYHANAGTVPEEVVATFRAVLQSDELTPLAKALFFKLPSERGFLDDESVYDFAKAAKTRDLLQDTLAASLEEDLVNALEMHATPRTYDPTSATFMVESQVRNLRNTCLAYLAKLDKQEYLDQVVTQFHNADNMNDQYAALAILVDSRDGRRDPILQTFYESWKDDLTLLNKWINAQTAARKCRPETLKLVQNVKGYKRDNPNHMRSVYRTFVNNLAAFHDPSGEGYKAVADAILELAPINEMVMAKYVMSEAFVDYKKLPDQQKRLMQEQLQRLLESNAPGQVRALAKQLLAADEKDTRG